MSPDIFVKIYHLNRRKWVFLDTCVTVYMLANASAHTVHKYMLIMVLSLAFHCYGTFYQKMIVTLFDVLL
jgi:hypothetical protein